MAIRSGFLIEICFVKLSSQAVYRDCHTNLYNFVGFPSHGAWGTCGLTRDSLGTILRLLLLFELMRQNGRSSTVHL